MRLFFRTLSNRDGLVRQLTQLGCDLYALPAENVTDMIE